MLDPRKAVATVFVAVLCLMRPGIGSAAEITVFSALGIKGVIEDLGPKFENTTGHKLTIKFGTLGQVVKMVRDGESADVVIIPRQGIDGIVKDGKAVAGHVADLAHSSVCVIFREGAVKLDISTPDALKSALLAAKSITYGNPTDGGASALHFVKVLDRLGIGDEVKSKTIYAKPGAHAGMIVAGGQAELGVVQWQSQMSVPGIANAGPLPGDLYSAVVFASAIMAGAKDAAASKALVDFLRTPAAGLVIRAKGMEPAN